MKRTDGRKTLEVLTEWAYASWEGAEHMMLEKSAAMTFRERLEWLESASELFRVISNAEVKPLCISKSGHLNANK